ncbi:dermonecrotic toxin domain-containing protein [Pseudomonas sp. XP1]
MPRESQAPQLASVSSNHLHDGFIGDRLPAWLKQATQSQVRALRESLDAHHATQARLRGITLALLSPRQFAERQFASLLRESLPGDVAFWQLEWLEVSHRFSSTLGAEPQFPTYGQRRENGLLRLMRNFAASNDFYLGTGLVAPGQERVLSRGTDELVEACRKLDAGRLYQQELDRTFDAAALRVLSEDKRSGLRLAVQVAALKGEITEPVKEALHALVDKPAGHQSAGLTGHPGLLEALGCPVADGVWIQLRDIHGQTQGGVLYLASDPVQALRYFDSQDSINRALVAELRHEPYRQAFSQLIGLGQRAGFMHKLRARLEDDQPDLELDGSVPQHDIFQALAAQQTNRVKQDGRLLLVPTADADEAASRERHEAWKAAGFDVLNLAGLFIPVVGGLLLGQLVAQALSEVFEGAQDWSRGHQHEALEHMLGVAEILAGTAATVAGVTIVRSAFVAALEPVRLANGAGRLWSRDLTAFASTPETTTLGADGAYVDGERRWMKADGVFYELHRPDPDGPWRLRHPSRAEAYGPVVLHNGERSWRLMHDEPQGWRDPAKMLDTLWPRDQPFDSQQAQQILRIAGIDQDELRGLLVENRRTPATLRETLRAFDADARIDTFFRHLEHDTVSDQDLQLLAWCEARTGSEKGRAAVLADRPASSDLLFARLTGLPESAEPLLKPLMAVGLPEAYARDLADGASHEARQEFVSGGKLPQSLATQARSLCSVAKVSRALAGLYLPSAYSNETGMLVLALLNVEAIEAFSLALSNAATDAVALKRIGSVGDAAEQRVLVREQGVFALYDGQGRKLAMQPPSSDIFQAVLAALESRNLLGRLGLAENADAQRLREKLMVHLGTHGEIAHMLGWAPTERWFNPGQRLADGRVGYLLSGRASPLTTPRDQLRAGLRRFFPGLGDSLETQVDRWLLQNVPVADALMALQDDFEQLNRALNRWVSAALSDTLRARRQLFAERLLRAWQALGDHVVVDSDGKRQGLRLVLNDLPTDSLPVLPAAVDFYHVTTLVLSETSIGVVNEEFLRAFTYLQELDMRHNQLLRCPRGLGYLTNLRRLRLGHNRIRLDAHAIEALNGLPLLSHLDLSHNSPLGVYEMRFHHLPHLVELNLRRCGLSEWPRGLELCGFLQRADLRDNFLRGVPDGVLAMPLEFRQRILIDGNRLSMADYGKLYALAPLLEEPEAAIGRAWWVGSDSASPERGELWDRLSTQDENARLFDLLELLQGLSDFSWPKSYLLRMGWQCLSIMATDAEFARQVQLAAAGAVKDDNGAIELFSRLLRLHAERDAAGDGAQSRGPRLLALGRALQRLDCLDEYVEAERQNLEGFAEPAVLATLAMRYRVRLRTRLRLPFQPARMRLRAADVGLSEHRLQSAEAAVGRADALNDVVADLCTRAFWQRFVQQYFARPFSDLEQLGGEQRAALAARRGELGEAQYLNEIQALDAQLRVDRLALRLQLTRHYVISLERAPG